jgi:bifunctional DNase/RNase
MVQVRVAGVALDGAGQHVILLKPSDEAEGDDRVLPIWIGAQEATSILIAVEGAQTPRPLTHDLIRSMLEVLGAVVERVEVTRIDDGTYYAEIRVRAGETVHLIDARPSDAVAIASRVGAPLFVADDVLAEAGVPGLIVQGDEEEAVEEFQRFLEDVDPDDFKE